MYDTLSKHHDTRLREVQKTLRSHPYCSPTGRNAVGTDGYTTSHVHGILRLLIAVRLQPGVCVTCVG
jgi:hypothetical protein